MVILKLKKIRNPNGLRTEDRSEMRWTSEQAQRRGAVAHQQVFGLLIGIQRHLVRFPPDARP
jgi:hypothetical protein